MNIEAGRDRYGVLRARVPPGNEPLGSFLEEDVQACISSCDRLLEKIAEVEQFQATSWKGTGNAHTVTLSHGGAKIETEFAIPEESVLLPLAEFKAAIEKWKASISQGDRF